MFYQRSSSKEWKGPGTVLGQDGAVVFVHHGGTYVRVHPCRFRKVDKFMKMRETVLFQSTNHMMLTRIQMKRTMPLSVQQF